MAKAQESTASYDSLEDTWEEVGDDNGEIIVFERGTVMYGTYLHTTVVELPEDKQKELKDGSIQTEANLFVFDAPDGAGRWSAWANFQISRAMEQVKPGDFIRMECKGERKAREGNVKIMSVMKRTSR